ETRPHRPAPGLNVTRADPPRLSWRYDRPRRRAMTTPPGKYVLIYDGLCRFCTAGAHRFVRWMGRVEVELLDFQKPGALDRFPGLSHDVCMTAMQLVTPEGRVYGGFEAAARAFATRRVVGWVAYLYYVPGLRQ